MKSLKAKDRQYNGQTKIKSKKQLYSKHYTGYSALNSLY